MAIPHSRMTLEQLRIFVAVAEREHVTRAAAALNLTQSAVSVAITSLEARHGVALFDRVGRRVVLNPAGAAFLAEARDILTRVAAAETALDDLSGLSRGRLSLHASQTIANYWLPPKLAAFHKTHPKIECAIAIGNTAQAAQAVIAGDVELGLIEGMLDDPALTRTELDRDEMVLIVAPDHAFVAAPPGSVADLLTTDWVMREPGSGTRSTFETVLASHGHHVAELSIAMEFPSNEAVRLAVKAGAGAAIVSRLAAEPGLANGAVVEIPFQLPGRVFYLLRHKQRYRSRAGDAFLALLGTPR
jgi:DNA-binding transcriptional LysR family regulator